MWMNKLTQFAWLSTFQPLTDNPAIFIAPILGIINAEIFMNDDSRQHWLLWDGD